MTPADLERLVAQVLADREPAQVDLMLLSARGIVPLATPVELAGNVNAK